MEYRVLAINPGSTSTKIAVFDDEQELFSVTLRHDAAELDKLGGLLDQYDFRKELVLDALKQNSVAPESLKAVIGRGGLVRPLKGGTYKVNEKMMTDLKDSTIWGRIHASNLGAFISDSIAKELGIPAFIVDPVAVDEFEDIARISGIPEIERKSLFHALNIRYTARSLAKQEKVEFSATNMIAAHMGGGISIAAIKKGNVVDANNALLGMGPFSPQRAGALPIGDLLEMAYSGKYAYKELAGYLSKNAGWMAYLKTDSGIEVQERIDKGDDYCRKIRDAMCYQISKEIGAYAAVLEGDVDYIFLTGGLAYGKELTDEIKKRVEFIAPVHVLPGENEMEALSQGGIRVLKGLEEAKEY
jgi:butyrate kinase